MELSPRDAAHVEQINRALKDFYLNGSNNVTSDNKQGFMDVCIVPTNIYSNTFVHIIN